MQTIYEWSVEVEDEHGDIIDVDFAPTLKEVLSYKQEGNIVLVRREGSEADGEVDRMYAYPKDGKLPEFFSYEEGDVDTGQPRVPKRFHKEYGKAYKKD